MRDIFSFFHGLFIPKEENNFRAKALHINFLTAYLILALFLTFSFRSSGNNVLGYATDITVTKLFDLTNQERAKNNILPLTYNEQLSEAASKKAQDMFDKNYWAHFGTNGTTPWQFIIGSGYQYEFAGENLAKNFMFSQGVVDAWMNSQSHKENLLRKDYKDVGFAIVNGMLNGEQTTLVVQMFGTPQTSSSAKFIKNNTPQQIQAVPPQQNVLSKTDQQPFNFYYASFNLNILFIVFLLLALALDFYFASKMKILKVGGKNIAHFMFAGFILLGMFLIIKGSII